MNLFRILTPGQMPTAEEWNRLTQMVSASGQIAADASTGIEVVRSNYHPPAIRLIENPDLDPPSSVALIQAVVVDIQDDLLKCVNFTQPTSGGVFIPQIYDPTLGSSDPDFFYVAKPYQLQRTPWDGQSVILNGDVVTFHYTFLNQRDAVDSSGSEQQVIVPDYFFGDLIMVCSATTGYYDPSGDVIELMDINSAARAWARSIFSP